MYISISVPSQIFNPRHAVTLSTLHSDLRNPPPPHNLPKAKSQLLMERGRGAIEWSLGGGGGMGVYEVRYGSAQVAEEKKRYGSAAARRRSKNCHRTSPATCTNPS